MNKKAEQIELMPPMIERGNVLRTIELLLDGPVEIVLAEGPDGMGKSTVLRQFATAHAHRSIMVELSGASRWAYDPQQVTRDIVHQIADLTNYEIPKDVADAVQLGRAFASLRQLTKGKHGHVYFVVDGLEEIPSNVEAARTSILELLPFGRPGFKFLMSSVDGADIPFNPAARRIVRSFPLPYFGTDEVAKYLTGFGLSDADIAEIIRITKGLPEKVASVRRLLVAGRDPAGLIRNLPEELPDLFELEWSSIDSGDRELMLALAILAHEVRAYTVDEVAAILNSPAGRLRMKLSAVAWVDIGSDGQLQLDSAATRKFVRERLISLRQEVNETLIEFLLRAPESQDALANLPVYFSDADRLQDLVQYLSPERFARIYREAPSLLTVQQHADRGIDAADKLGREDDYVRFSLQRSEIEEIARSRARRAEVRARAAVGDYATANALAESAARLDVKLELLVALARVMKSQGAAVDEGLLERIRGIYEDLISSPLPESVSEVAADLFHIAPDLAIELVTRAAADGAGDGDENALDWARTGLAIQARIAAEAEDPHARQQAQDIQNQIKDPSLRRFSVHAVAVLGNLSSSEVIAETEQLEHTGDKLFVLQHWMIGNRNRSDAKDVLKYGLGLALRATEYTATARVYRELALCLPHIEGDEHRRELVDLLDGQGSVLERLGPPEDYIRLRLIIARAVEGYDPTDAQERLLDVYNKIDDIEDDVVRVASIARLAATLARMGDSGESDGTLHELVEQGLTDGVSQILSASADHFEVCRGIISALAVSRPERALEIISAMNTVWRRDLGYKTLAETAVSVPASEIPAAAVHQSIEAVQDPGIYDSCAKSVLIGLIGRSMDAESLRSLTPVIRCTSKIHDPVQRISDCAEAAAWLRKQPGDGVELAKDLMDTVEETWRKLDASWEKLDAGFNVLTAVADSATEDVDKWISRVNELKEILRFEDRETTLAASLGTMLAIRAFGGMAAHRVETPDDMERLFATISRCGSARDQARLLAEFALRCYFADRRELAEQIVQDRLLPLLSAMSEDDPNEYEAAVSDTAAALHLGAPHAARGLIESLETHRRDEALGSTAWSLLRGVSMMDAYEHHRHQGFSINYETACSVLSLMERMVADWRIYDLLESLVESVLLSRAEINRAQRAELIRQLDDLVAAKFPAPGYIQHDGYAVVASAHINRLRLPADRVPTSKLAKDARSIPNTADRAYVLGVVAATTGGKEAKSLFREALETAESIPMLVDRLDRYQLLSSLAEQSDRALSKQLLEKALRLASAGEGESIEDRRRSLISAAYRIDPEYAVGIAQISDDDPARDRVERQIKVYKLRDSIAVRRPDAAPAEEMETRLLPRAAWLKLGALNAGRISACSAQYTLPLLRHAAPLPVSDAYPIFALYIENAVRHARSPEVIRRYVTPLFEACLRGAELAVLTADREDPGRRYVKSGERRSGVILPGERERGLQLIDDWLASSDADETLYLCEPYFRPGDVHLLALVKDRLPEAHVIVLTSRDSVAGISGAIQDAYVGAWRRIRSDDPPETTVIVAETRYSKKFPPHDRWWLTRRKAGISIGTSFGGIGARISTVRVLDQSESEEVFEVLRPYFKQERVALEGERLVYSSFML